MIFFVEERKTWVISSGGCWLPGSFKTKGAANMAFRLKDESLYKLSKEINIKRNRAIELKDVKDALEREDE